MKVIEMDFLFIWKIYLCSRFGFVLCQYSLFFIPLFHCILILYYYGSLIFDFLLVFDYNYKLELVEDFSFLFLLRIRLLLFICLFISVFYLLKLYCRCCCWKRKRGARLLILWFIENIYEITIHNLQIINLSFDCWFSLLYIYKLFKKISLFEY